jgi:hypothetical protein
MTALQELIRAFKRDKMQEFYTKEQMICLLEFKLEREQEQLNDAYLAGEAKDEQYFKEQYLKK